MDSNPVSFQSVTIDQRMDFGVLGRMKPGGFFVRRLGLDPKMNAADISVYIGIWKRPAILIDADRTLLSQQVDRCTKPAAPPCKL